jgi:type IV pilus assembly protein PilW
MRFPTCTRQTGLSLVELMVGMAVGLIGIVIISHLYVTNEQYKRSTTGAGAAQVNGAIALYTVERDLRMAGYGINHTNALGCACDTVADPDCSPLQYYFGGTYSSPPAAAGSVLRTLKIAPVVIVKTANQPDSITLLYGGDNERATPVRLLQTMAPPNYDYNTEGTAGFEDGNLIVVTQGANCALAQITVNAANSLLLHAAGAYNPVQNGTLPKFARDASVFNLGITPIWRTYAIVNNTLTATEVLPPQGGIGAQGLVDDIVDLQALYGKDTDNDANRTVDVYDGVTPTTAAGWQQVLAVRIAVLARSQNYEKPTAAGVCTATTAANQPVWGRTGAAPAGNVFPALQAAGGLPSCYKYRVFETIVPLRNMIWR